MILNICRWLKVIYDVPASCDMNSREIGILRRPEES
jgi:hypothetical protein